MKCTEEVFCAWAGSAKSCVRNADDKRRRRQEKNVPKYARVTENAYPSRMGYRWKSDRLCPLTQQDR
jgi:hypothetical protein